jgi:membrane-bound ClpP family serine protease
MTQHTKGFLFTLLGVVLLIAGALCVKYVDALTGATLMTAGSAMLGKEHLSAERDKAPPTSRATP